jgi:predicted ester cyclase
VLQRMLELWNGADLDPAEVYARGCTVDGGVDVFDPEDVLPEIRKYRAAFPDLRWSVERWLATGERYVLRMQATGTHTGAAFRTEIGTVEATGRPFTLQGLEVFELRDDRIVDSWQAWDMGQLYAAPA